MEQFDYLIDSIDTLELERPPSQSAKVYSEQVRQAHWAFNLCCLLGLVGIAQAIAGIVAVFVPAVASWATGALLGSGGIFGLLSHWGLRISDAANQRLERIASDEKAEALLREMGDSRARDRELGLYCQYRLKNPHSANRKIHHLAEMVVYKFSRSVENGTGW